MSGPMLMPPPLREEYLVRPRSSNRPPPPPEIPASLTDDYGEACAVLSLSPKASAALSRRCLQNLLQEAAGVKKGHLNNQIDAVLNSKQLPSHISDFLHAVRSIGNFAAHPSESQSTGQIVPVEPGEAEACLDTIELLFDFYYVQPAEIAARKAELNKKLTNMEKPTV